MSDMMLEGLNYMHRRWKAHRDSANISSSQDLLLSVRGSMKPAGMKVRSEQVVVRMQKHVPMFEG